MPCAPWQLAQTGRDQKPQLVQALAVYALQIRRQIIGVTIAARLHLVFQVDRRTGVADGRNVVRG